MYCQCKKGEAEGEKSANLLCLSPPLLISATWARLGEDVSDAKTVLLRTILLVLYNITKVVQFSPYHIETLSIWMLQFKIQWIAPKSLSLSPIIIHAIENQTRLNPF